MQQSEKLHLDIGMHVADLERARVCADKLGVGLEDYVLLATHVVNTAVLSGTSTAQVPPSSATTKWWKETGTKCVQSTFDKAA